MNLKEQVGMRLTTFYLIRTGSSIGAFELSNKASVPLSEGAAFPDQWPVLLEALWGYFPWSLCIISTSNSNLLFICFTIQSAF
jgi:hypothetical protein